AYLWTLSATATRRDLHSSPTRRSSDLRITSSNEQTSDLLDEAVTNLTRQIGPSKLRGFILDLRNNPGGLLDQAIAVSDEFMDGGETVSTRGRHADDTQRYNARRGDVTHGKPIIVLLNGGSPSASEIVAGALQVRGRATSVGRRPSGQGSLQTILPLGSDGARRLTPARYSTPPGRSIQAKGIVPDIVVTQTPPEDKKRPSGIGESSLPGH